LVIGRPLCPPPIGLRDDRRVEANRLAVRRTISSPGLVDPDQSRVPDDLGDGGGVPAVAVSKCRNVVPIETGRNCLTTHAKEPVSDYLPDDGDAFRPLAEHPIDRDEPSRTGIRRDALAGAHGFTPALPNRTDPAAELG